MTHDYYLTVNEMTEDNLHKEIERLTKALFTMSPESPVFDQVHQMLSMAQDAQNDKMFLRKYKDKSENTALDIGHVSSTVTMPDYSKEGLLNATVTSYTSELRDKNE